jgi:hypothetical protein
MNSMVVGRNRNVDVVNPKGGYQKPFIVTVPIFNHRNDHYVRPNKVALKYLDFKKNVDPYAHVKVKNCSKSKCQYFERVYHECV